MDQDNHSDFSCMLFELIRTQGQDKFVYTCNNCERNVETRWHCNTCDDFDLCGTCYLKDGHPHTMLKLGFDLDDGSEQLTDEQTNSQEERKLLVQRGIQSLMHASQCQDANCRLPGCGNLKLVLQHTKSCPIEVKENCPTCKPLIGLWFYHARHCQDTECAVPVCSSLKQKLELQQVQDRLLQQQSCRRMAGMNSGITETALPSSLAALSLGSSVQNSSSSSHHLSQQHSPHTTGMGYPTPQVMTPPQMQRNMAQIPVPNMGSVDHPSANLQNEQSEQRFPSLSVLLQSNDIFRPSNPHLLQQPQTTNASPIMNSQQQALAGACGGGGGIIINQNAVGPPQQNMALNIMQNQNNQPVQRNTREVLRELLAVLQWPNSERQQDKILQILESNPQLMAAFIKQRQQALLLQKRSRRLKRNSTNSTNLKNLKTFLEI